MSMTTTALTERVSRSLRLSSDLAAALDSPALGCRNGTSKSNTIGQQFWCVIGARESYAKAILQSNWQGFACSLTKDDVHDVTAIRAALERSRELVLASIEQVGAAGWNEKQIGYILDIIEHEAQHHGQLIRFYYSNKIEFPRSLSARYSLR